MYLKYCAKEEAEGNVKEKSRGGPVSDKDPQLGFPDASLEAQIKIYHLSKRNILTAINILSCRTTEEVLIRGIKLWLPNDRQRFPWPDERRSYRVANLERVGHPAAHLWAATIERRATECTKDTSGSHSAAQNSGRVWQNARL